MTRYAVLAIWLGLLGSNAAAQSSPDVAFVGSLTWRSDAEGFGGFSGIELDADGKTFWVVSDAGILSSGVFERQGENEVLKGVVGFAGNVLLQRNGRPVEGYLDDAEGLAMAADGTLYVSFEGEHRIWAYPDITPDNWDGSGAIEVEPHTEFPRLQNNSSLEALAVAPDGTLITIPERSGVLTRPFPAYRFQNGAWIDDASIRREPPYLVVGADFGPDGKFYLLERHLQGIFGFQSRVRRFDYGPDGFTNEVQILETRAARHDNLEGMSVWRDGKGRIRLTMISDDNFRGFQRTEIVEYAVTE